VSFAIAAGPHQHLGLVLSFWEFVQTLEKPRDPYQPGQALRTRHEKLKEFHKELPTLALISEAQQLLDQLVAQSHFGAADAEMLLRVS
jgi:hypothetical protein